MYLAIDVGATKTLLAVFTSDGKLKHCQKIKTASSYGQFLKDLKAVTGSPRFKEFELKTTCCAVPGKINRPNGLGINFGNLGWRNVPIAKDIKAITKTKVLIENDAKLGGLYQAVYHKKYKKLLYITLSTGIGGGFIVDGKIDKALADSEAGRMVLEHEGKLRNWEQFASGKALVRRFGKKAEELDNPFAWKTYARDVARGLEILLAVLQPDVVVVGGSVGAYLEKYIKPLKQELQKNADKMVPIPPIIEAVKPEETVAYGCYEYIKQNIS